jgi:primase-polymerase (primpol)-like protein
MSTPEIEGLCFNRIPAALKRRRQWVLWKTVLRGGKPTKVPFQPNGREARSNDPETWAPFPKVVSAYGRGGYDGIGYVFSFYDPYVGIDLDGCRDPQTGEVTDWAREVITKLDSYSEVSPSGTGVKIFVEGKSPFDTGKKKDLDVERIADKQPGIEMYPRGRYFAVTGWRLAGVSTKVEQRELYWLREKFWPPAPTGGNGRSVSDSHVFERARKYIAKMPPAISGQAGHNQTFHVACTLALGFALSEEQTMQALREYNARCVPPWSEKELLHKAQSAMSQAGERGYLRDAVRGR